MASTIGDESLLFHQLNKGKLHICSKIHIRTKKDLALAYTPGVAEVCREIAKDKDKAYDYTIKGNSVAIVTDGSAVLGLGNIGGHAAIPVMEGKAILFKEFANIDAFPICFENYHVDFIDDVANIAPVFGAINLEDIAAPKCFEVEEKLQDIGIPVMHDDQHGTAIVVLAGLINATKLAGKKIEDMTVVISGAGAAGTAIAKLLKCIGYDAKLCRAFGDVILCDSKGIIHRERKDLNKYKQEMAELTNSRDISGSLADALIGADVFIGVSVGNLVTRQMVTSMAKDPIIFALANPDPEIMPEKAREAGARLIATGRSDYPNQINNVLAFPGIFRGALDAHASKINNVMKLAAANALAGYLKNPTVEEFIPSPLDRRVPYIIAQAVKNAAVETGVSRLKGQVATYG